MAAEESLSQLDSQVSTDAAPPEINPEGQENVQTCVAIGKDVHAEIEESDNVPFKNESSSFVWNDACSSFEDGKWQMQLEMYKNLMPSDIRIDYFDVLLLYSEDNKSAARQFCDHLKNDIKLKDNESVKAVLYDEFVAHAGSKLRNLQTALERCTYVFCYITKEFCEDKWIELSKDECLIEAIENEEKQWCVVPVITVPVKRANFKLPFGLRSLVSIRYDQNDQYYRDTVSRLIQNNLHQRLVKERKQKKQQFTWFQENIGALCFGDEGIRCLENKEKLRTKKQEKEKNTEEARNKSLICSQPVLLEKPEVQTDTDLHQQPSNISEGRGKLIYRGQCGESISVNNDSICNNSIKSTDQLSQGFSINNMEPVSFEFLTSGTLLDGLNSTVVSSSINSCTDEKRPIQEESDIQPDSDYPKPLRSRAFREGTDSDNGYHSDQSVAPVSQKNDPSHNICIESPGSTNHMWPADNADLQDIGSLSLNPELDGMHLTSDNGPLDRQITPGCWGSVEEEKEQSLEPKSKDHSKSVKKTREEKENFSALFEKEFGMEMNNNKHQDAHIVSTVKYSKGKLVATETPRRKVCKNRHGEKTDLDNEDRETNGDTGVETLHETELEETLPKIVDKAISKISPCRERPQTDFSHYQVSKKPAAPLLTREYLTPFAATILMQRGPMPAKPIESDELD
ncbi:hypothetical protein CHS0354_020034 [Potamilus streckersoni]|uniref:TIR domain-containing protein n=1 Tax=Potamilus streckersoni TaxID=2493646 RepID=A0AAE0S7M5_9BIVA|nr:hypothetical protein CHS0354_020034 [Potamilus streckersoni]